METKSSKTKWVIIIVLLVVVAGAAYYYFGVYKPKKKLTATQAGAPEAPATVPAG